MTRRSARTVALVAAALMATAGCTASNDRPTAGDATPGPTQGAQSPSPQSPSSQGPSPQSSGVPAESTDSPVLAGDATTEPKSGKGSGQANGQRPALLEHVRIGGHNGFDRIVWEFTGEIVPQYKVEYVDGPIREDGSGDRVDVAGQAHLQIVLAGASGVDMSTPNLTPTYTGPRRLDASELGGGVTEVVSTGDFEAVMTWVAGTTGKLPFAVTTLSSPARIVLDIKTS